MEMVDREAEGSDSLEVSRILRRPPPSICDRPVLQGFYADALDRRRHGLRGSVRSLLERAQRTSFPKKLIPDYSRVSRTRKRVNSVRAAVTTPC